MISRIISLTSGTIFGVGLSVSNMINPEKVLGFLDLFGQWDPSLIFVPMPTKRPALIIIGSDDVIKKGMLIFVRNV